MSLASRRRMMLKGGTSSEDTYWQGRLGHFNRSYTLDNNWWLNGDFNNEVVSLMNYAKSNFGASYDYFYVINIRGTYYLYVSNSPFYVTYKSNQYILLYDDGTKRIYSQSINKSPYGQKDGIQYLQDYTRPAEIIETIITNYPIFDWDETIPDKIPLEGGAIASY